MGKDGKLECNMAIRRAALLTLGLAGSVFAAGILYLSVMYQYSIIYEKTAIDAWASLEEVTALEPADVVFPTVIPGTTLLAKELTSYDGPFAEDGTDREVVGAAALLVENFGKDEIMQTQICLFWGEQQLIFSGEMIPPGMTVLLLEQSATASLQKNFTACKGWQICSRTENRLQKQVLVSERAMGTVIVTNATEEPLHNICLYYKSWYSPQNILIGGITYSVSIPVLAPGQTEYLYPPHYAIGYSKVVSVHIEEKTGR